jgi:outer membrane receptor protein involved in Fe transport
MLSSRREFLGHAALGFGGVALAALLSAQAAMAQAPSEAAGGQLEEVVVTATRQSSNVNRVPLSVSAVTQRSIEQQGVKTVEDLSRTVPGLTFRRTGGENNPNITIRGIGGNGATVGSPTTGVYLDDTALQRRNVNGLITGNGSPFPQLFDLERVEVLRGPQGTLYGGSSQGGTVRFITPTPSLTRYGGQARLELSHTNDGGWNYDVGAAVGGPIVEDKLGFRASVSARRQEGWIDHLSMYDGHRFAKNTNDTEGRALRAALLFAPTANFRITPAVYWSSDRSRDDETFWLPVAAVNVGAATVAGRTFNNSGTVNGVRFQLPNTVFPAYTTNAMPWYGPYKTGNGRYTTTGAPSFVPSPRLTQLFLPSLTLDWDLGGAQVKSITSYLHDNTKGTRFSGGGGVRTAIIPFSILGNVAPPYLQGFPDRFSYYYYTNTRKAWSEELRISTDQTRRLSVVAGGYFSDSKIHVHGGEHSNENIASIFFRGAPEAFFLGAYPLPSQRNPASPLRDDISDREVFLNERELAAFGEATFAITDKLKLIAGARITHYRQNFDQIYGGAVAGAPGAGVSFANPAGFTGSPLASTGIVVTDPNATSPFPMDLAGCPTSPNCPLQYTSLKSKETPFTPKIGLSWQVTEDDLLYATMAKGFRAGGVNPPVPPLQCASDLAAIGISAAPTTFKSDTVTSYEGGAKMRMLGNRLQVNSSVFYIDWKDVQFNLPLRGCGFAYLANAASAVSKGLDVQAQGRFGPFTLSGAASLTDAAYSKDVLTPPNAAGQRGVLARKGDNLGVPEWQVTLAAQYDFKLANTDAYIRGDYTYTGKYDRTTGVGTTSYDAIIHDGDSTNQWNARAGITIDKVDVSVFILNLTNSQDFINKGHGVNSPLVTATSLRPTTVGVQASYRY